MFPLVAYHVLCRDCAIASKQCAKCLKKEGEVEIIPPGPTPEEKLKLDIEMKHLVKSLPERKRRTFLRFMHGKKKPKQNSEDDEQAERAEEQPEKVRRTRDELLNKIESLKCTEDDEFYKGVIEDDEDDDDSWDSEDYLSDDD